MQPLNTEQSRVLGSGAGAALSAGASERPRPLWPGMNATLTVSGGKHVMVLSLTVRIEGTYEEAKP